MDALQSIRRNHLSSAFRERLAVETEEMDSTRRFAWCVLQIEDYLGRWVGLSQSDSVTVTGLLNSDLHFVLANAVIVADSEVLTLLTSDPVKQAWSSFAAFVQLVSADDNKQDTVAELIARFEKLRLVCISSGYMPRDGASDDGPNLTGKLKEWWDSSK